MLLTITTTHEPAADLGYLLHKHPERCQSFELSFGQAHVFYPEVSGERTSAALLLDVDPVGMVRGKYREQSFLLGHYVNDRPYVASSFLSVAIAQVFGSAMSGRCKDREELAKTPIPLTARIEVLPVRGGETLVQRMFEPLGYAVETTQHPLDENFPEWGDSPYFSLTIAGTKLLSELLTHLYVLIPVFDNQKHYFVGDDEIEKLLKKGAGWLASHPEKEQITRRYLRHRSNLYREALARLAEEGQIDDAEDEPTVSGPEEQLEQTVRLNDQRLGTVLASLRGGGARSVLDLGCGEGKLLRDLLADCQFERIVGMDVSIRSLEIAQRRLNLDRLPDSQAERIKLIHGSLIYRDQRLANFDAAAVVEVIEHLDPPRLSAFERVVFECARPKTVVLTTPNCEYNVKWETLPAGQFRHPDHRFEWTRQEFKEWATRVATQHRYSVRFVPVGPVDQLVGSPTQMAVFLLESPQNKDTDQMNQNDQKNGFSTHFARLHELSLATTNSAYEGWFANLPQKVSSSNLAEEWYKRLESEFSILDAAAWGIFKSKVLKQANSNRRELISLCNEAAGYARLKQMLAEQAIDYDTIQQPVVAATKGKKPQEPEWIALLGNQIVAAIEVKTVFQSDHQNALVESNTSKLNGGGLPTVDRLFPAIHIGLLNKLASDVDKAKGQLRTVQGRPKLLIAFVIVNVDDDAAQLPNFKEVMTSHLDSLSDSDVIVVGDLRSSYL